MKKKDEISEDMLEEKTEVKEVKKKSQIEIKNEIIIITLGASISFNDEKIEKLELSHSLLSFNSIKIDSSGEFGEFKGSYSIFDKKFLGELIPSKIMKSKYRNVLNQFKLKDGKYYYEYKF